MGMDMTRKKTRPATIRNTILPENIAIAHVLVLFLVHHGGHLAHAYSQGAPSDACFSMEPFHGAPAQDGASPYSLSLSSREVLPSQVITVTINGSDFRGFMVVAFSSDFPLGTMIPGGDDFKTVCDGLGMTHTSQRKKTEVSFKWKAPDDLLPDSTIDFKATVVKTRLVYWVGVVVPYSVVSVEVAPSLPPGGGSGGSTDQTPGDASAPITTNNNNNTTTTTTTTTENGPTGVLPTPGPPLPMTSPTSVNVNPGGMGNPGGSQGNSHQFPTHLHPDPDCGKSKACFHDCQRDGTCTYIISWRDLNPENLTMTFTYRLPGPQEHWIAVGFSRDQEMGDDSVTECIMEGDKVAVKQSYNDGLDNRYLDNKNAAIHDASGSVVNGVLHCTFIRKKVYPRDPLVFDLNLDYFLLVAMGEGLKGNKLPHTFDVLPPVSDHRMNLQGLENTEGETPPVSILIQLHGILMVLAWVLLTSLGIMTAKYGKPMLPKVNPCGANIWFQVHRGCMVMVTLMTVAGVALMFVQCEGYCKIPQVPGKSHWPLHPPVGLLVLILTLINPIMAVFRPGPKAPNRFVFNWTHWGVGVLAWIMASFTVLIGLTLERAHAPPEALYVMVVWGVYHILILVAMETMPRPLSKLYSAVAEKTLQRGRVYNLERAQHDNMGYQAEDVNTNNTTDSQDVQKKEEKKANKELTREELKVQRLLLALHYVVVFTLTFALLLVVYLYTPSHA